MPHLSLKKINIIGCGKLGMSLASDIIKHSLGKIIAISNRNKHSSQIAIESLSAGIAYYPIEELPAADFIFITTPDPIIQICADALCQNPNLQANTIIAHCSGVLSANILNALKTKGCLLVAMHPIRSFSAAKQQSFREAYTALEGDPIAIDRMKQLFAPLHLQWLEIKGEYKASYHSASVFASNYVISVLHQAQKSYQHAGVHAELALKICCDLAQSVLDNVKSSHSLKQALTGPLARGDVCTLSQHVKPMTQPTKKLYKTLALNLLELCDLTEEKIKQIVDLLDLDE